MAPALLPVAFTRLLLLPLEILAFALLLLLFGAFGLAVALAVISLLSRVWRFLSRGQVRRSESESPPAKASRPAGR